MSVESRQPSYNNSLHSSWLYFSDTYLIDETNAEEDIGSFRPCSPVERRSTMLGACNVSGDVDSSFRNISREVLANIFVDDRHKVMGCFVAKVACSTWKYVLINATGKVSNTPPEKIPVHSRAFMRTLWLHVLSDYTPEEVDFRLRNYYKFMVVRHPFDRLTSAYREKFGPKNKVFHKMLGKKIIEKYRKNAKKKSLRTGSDVTFGEFVKFLINERPTKYNAHWRRYYEVCDPCRVKYDYVAKLETITQDARIILPKLAFSSDTKLPGRNVNLRPTTYDIGQGKNLSDMFTELPSGDVAQLMRIYDLDFRLFGYQWDRTLDTARCHTPSGADTCC